MTVPRPALLGGSPIRQEGPPEWPLRDPAVFESVRRALEEGAWGRYAGPFGEALAEKLAEEHAARHVRPCASGTAAVELALRGLDVGPGDEVVMSAYDFPANFKNILAIGAMPVLVDCRADDAQIDIDKIEGAGSPRTKAILVSHLHAGVVDMSRLRALADEAGWSILEDACQTPLSLMAGRAAGMWGDAGVISFGGSKLLTAGRGGCVVTNRDDVAQRIRLHVERGNDLSPLSEIQAALLLPQIDALTERRAHRIDCADLLRVLLGTMSGLRPFPNAAAEERDRKTEIGNRNSEIGKCRLPTTDHRPPASGHRLPNDGSSIEPDYYKFAFWYDRAGFDGLDRETFAAAMRAEGIAIWPAFKALHQIHAKSRYRAAGALEIAERAHRELLVLHHPVLLGGRDDIVQIGEAFEKIARFAGELARLPQYGPAEYAGG